MGILANYLQTRHVAPPTTPSSANQGQCSHWALAIKPTSAKQNLIVAYRLQRGTSIEKMIRRLRQIAISAGPCRKLSYWSQLFVQPVTTTTVTESNSVQHNTQATTGILVGVKDISSNYQLSHSVFIIKISLNITDRIVDIRCCEWGDFTR